MKLSKNQPGSGTHIVWLLVTALVAISYIGLRIYQANKLEVHITNYQECVAFTAHVHTSNPLSCIVDEKTFIKETENTPGTKAKSSLKIKEWGIKITFSGVEKVTYISNEEGPISLVEEEKLATSSAQLMYKAGVMKGSDCDEVGLTAYQFNSKPQYYTSYQKVGNKYYLVTEGPGTCTDIHDAAIKAEVIEGLTGTNPEFNEL